MALAIRSGTHLGPNEILAPLGAGGMGEVYRARDTRLDPIEALKGLPADGTSAQALERFEREASSSQNIVLFRGLKKTSR